MRPRLLIIDDEKNIAFAVRSYFVRRGYDVDCATTSAQASDLIARREYSLLIVDVRLSGSESRDGMDLALRIRQQGSTMPIILLTAYLAPDVQRDAHDVGNSAVMIKPARLPEVSSVADVLLARQRVASAAEPVPASRTAV